MASGASSELILIRHALAVTGGRLAGRRDVPADLSNRDALKRLITALENVGEVVTSPALRCRQTAGALFPDRAFSQDARLWEQDFGDQEGLRFEDLPNLGDLSRADLAKVAPAGGESFADMVKRVSPALQELAGKAMNDGPIVVVAHAGTVRAGLSIALDEVPTGLAFEVDPLSITRLRCLPAGFSVMSVNVPA